MINSGQTIEQIRAWFPLAVGRINVGIRGSDVSITIHEVADYALATEILRGVGISVRDKQIFESEKQFYVNLSGRTPEGIEVKVYCTQLPPTCRLEKAVTRIPKQQTVDTGDFIEVERMVAVCGEGD